MTKSLVGKMQRLLSENPLAVAIAIKLMNQCRLVVGRHLAPSCDPRENGEQAVLEALAPQIGTFIDVGANAGHWASALLSAAGANAPIRGVLVEANDALVGALREQFSSFHHVAIEACAVGAEPGIASFFVSPTCSEHSSLYATSAVPSEAATRVRVETVDGLMKQHGIDHLDFLKVDTEGADFDVILGAKEGLASGAIDFIQFEYGDGWKIAGHTLAGAMRFLKEYGYNCYLITPRGLETYNFKKYGEMFLYANFFAVSDRAQKQAASVMRRLGCQ